MQQFLLENQDAYQKWRESKLRDYPENIEQLIVNICDPYTLTDDEKYALLKICHKTNLVIYRGPKENVEDIQVVTAIAEQLGLKQRDANLFADQDRISSIQAVDKGRSSAYIPYTKKPLNWHTDGYYNQDQIRIRAFLMHCVRPANEGGENSYLDPEIVYIQIRDEDPDYIKALMDKEAMTIPPNIEEDDQIRDEKTGPVFLIDEKTQTLCMRFTARSRNIKWNDNSSTQRARTRLLELLNNNHYIFNYRLQAGEGVICNNVLHNRTMFEDNPRSTRLLYRARFYDRVSKPDQMNNLQVTSNVVAK